MDILLQYIPNACIECQNSTLIPQLTLFSMITRLPDNILNKIATDSLLIGDKKSWFTQILFLCNQYGLPHPQTLLQNPLEKAPFKSLIKLKIADYWQTLFINRSADLTSLRYFKPDFMSLLKPHPIYRTVTHSYDVNKMVVQLRMPSRVSVKTFFSIPLRALRAVWH